MEGPLAALPEEERIEYMWHDTAWSLSQFLHGEQGALLVASQLVSCAPTYQAKLYAASQTFDEARHVTFGVNYLEEFLTTLSEEEVEDRAMFAYEACVVMRDRIINTELPARWFNISEEEIREMLVNNDTQDMFTNLLFSRVMPNLKRIGLLTDKVLPLYEKLNLTSYMDAESEFEIDWAELNKPLESSKEIDQQSEKELAAHTAQGLF